MMSGRPGNEPFTFLPDKARSLPPPKLTDPRLVYIGFLGYCTGLLDNALWRRPVLQAGEGCVDGSRPEEGLGAARHGPPPDPCFSGLAVCPLELLRTEPNQIKGTQERRGWEF